jgi:hypothetical protein
MLFQVSECIRWNRLAVPREHQRNCLMHEGNARRALFNGKRLKSTMKGNGYICCQQAMACTVRTVNDVAAHRFRFFHHTLSEVAG